MADYQPKPYDPRLDDLKGFSEESVQAHYKLYEAYCNKYNEASARLAEADKSKANQIFSDYRAAAADLTFAIGGIKNHEIYFGHLGGDGSPVDGAFSKQVEQDFGSWDDYIADLTAAGMAARGWAWTAWDTDFGTLMNVIGDAQNTFPVWNAFPVVALDVYEHSYVADFSTARPKYIEAFLANMDWQAVEDRFAAVRGR
ncbi:MAG: Fe-Mn family superoxide dismutase [Patescibacteria group bacterium]